MDEVYRTGKTGNERESELALLRPGHLSALAKCFNREHLALDKFQPSVFYGGTWRGMFTLGRDTGRLIYLHCKGSSSKADPYDLDVLYARWHGVAKDAVTCPICFMYRRRLLHEVGVRKVERTLFRRPNEKFRAVLQPAKREYAFSHWHNTVALLAGLGLAQDLHDNPKEPTPYASLFAAHWIWWQLIRNNEDDDPRVLNDPKGPAAQFYGDMFHHMRRNLVQAGLIRYVGQGYKVRYAVQPPGEGERGVDARELRLWQPE